MRDMKPEQRRQCRRFLAELRCTANIKLSAERAAVTDRTVRRWREAYPTFDTQYAAALAFARAQLATHGPALPGGATAKTRGGEYATRGGRNGLQVQRAHPGELSNDGVQLFLQTLAATANIGLACETVSISYSTVYRLRDRSASFADRMDAALAQGHERLEFALMESALCSLAPEEMAGHWQELGVEPPSPLAVMTFDQVIISMGMHMKRVVLGEKRRARNAHVTTSEETDAAITKLLGMFAKRKAALEKIDWETGERPAAEVAAVEESGAALEDGAGSPDKAAASVRVRTFE